MPLKELELKSSGPNGAQPADPGVASYAKKLAEVEPFKMLVTGNLIHDLLTLHTKMSEKVAEVDDEQYSLKLSVPASIGHDIDASNDTWETVNTYASIVYVVQKLGQGDLDQFVSIRHKL